MYRRSISSLNGSKSDPAIVVRIVGGGWGVKNYECSGRAFLRDSVGEHRSSGQPQSCFNLTDCNQLQCPTLKNGSEIYSLIGQFTHFAATKPCPGRMHRKMGILWRIVSCDLLNSSMRSGLVYGKWGNRPSLEDFDRRIQLVRPQISGCWGHFSFEHLLPPINNSMAYLHQGSFSKAVLLLKHK